MAKDFGKVRKAAEQGATKAQYNLGVMYEDGEGVEKDEWIIDRYEIKTHDKSEIVNDPNDWSEDKEYILKLLKKVIHVSVESVKIINALPALDI